MSLLHGSKEDEVICIDKTPCFSPIRKSCLAWNNPFLLLITFFPYLSSIKTFHFVHLLRPLLVAKFMNCVLKTIRSLKFTQLWGAWVAQSLKRPTLAQVMISRLVGLSPPLGSVLTAQSLESASDSCLPLSLCPSPAHAVSHFLKNK